MKWYLLGFTLIVGISAGAGAYGGVKYGEYKQAKADDLSTRENAILYNCGGYNGTTGVFEWKLKDSAESIIMGDESTKKMRDDQNKLEAKNLAARKAEIEAAKKKAGGKL